MRSDLPLLIVVAVGLLAVGCNRKPAAPAAGAAPAGPTVTVVTPEMRAVARVVEQPGVIMAFEETALYAKLPGLVERIELDPDKSVDHLPHDRQMDIGSRVKRGQVLVVIGIPELEAEWQQKNALVKQAEAEIAQAEKAVEAARAGVAAAESGVAVADAGVDRAQALYERWQKEVERIGKLLTGGVGDSQTLDETKNQLRAAEAGRKEAVARVVAAQATVKKAAADEAKAAADVAAARAKREVAAAEVVRLDALRGYTTIKAPFDGVVTRRAVNTGDFVTGNEKAGLFAVARMNPVRVVVHVPEADAGLVAIGQDVRLAVQAVPGELKGKVVRTSWALEPGSRTLRTELDLPNERGALRPGMYVHAQLTAPLPDAWSVPAAAVGKVGEESVVYLVEGGKAARATVQLLKGDGQFTQVRRYKKMGAPEWTEVTGSEQVATPAAALTDGQNVP